MSLNLMDQLMNIFTRHLSLESNEHDILYKGILIMKALMIHWAVQESKDMLCKSPERRQVLLARVVGFRPPSFWKTNPTTR